MERQINCNDIEDAKRILDANQVNWKSTNKIEKGIFGIDTYFFGKDFVRVAKYEEDSSILTIHYLI